MFFYEQRVRNFFLFIAQAGFLLAISDSSADCGFGIGYRKDEMQLTLSQGGRAIYKEADEHLQAVEIEAMIGGTGKLFLFSLKGDAGWYCSGRTNHTISTLVPGQLSYESSFEEGAGGIFSDGEVLFGIHADRGGLRAALKAGCCVFYQQIQRGSPHPQSSIIPGEVAIASDLSQSPLKRLWWGPSLGGTLSYQPQASWKFDAGYFYYFLRFYQHFEASTSAIYLGGPAAYFIQGEHQASSLPGQGQLFFGKVAAEIARCLWLNLRLDLLYFHTNKNKKTTSWSQSIQQVLPVISSFSEREAAQLQAWWHSFDLLMEVEYFF